MRALNIFLLVIASIFLAILTYAEVPNYINYQGRVTDGSGNPITGSKLLKFKIYGSPTGNDSLWSSAFRTVQISDGLFDVKLGEVVPLPEDLFAGDNPLYLGITIDTDPEATPRCQFTTVPYAYHAAKADTSDWALGGPGAGAWVDDGTVVRLATSSDQVGIGTLTASEPLVVGKDLGAQNGDFIVVGNDTPDRWSGYKWGEDENNHAVMIWGNNDNSVSIRSKVGGSYQNGISLVNGRVGLGGVFVPSEPLAIGLDLGSYYGDFVQIGKTGSGQYSGFMCGEDADNRATMLWYNNSNELRLGYKSGGTDYGAAMILKDGELHLAGSGDNSVQLPTNAISADEILDEAGLTYLNESSTWQWIDDNPMVLNTVSLTLPGPGYVLVNANINFAANLQSEDSSHAAACVQISKSPNDCESSEYASVNQSTNESWCTEWNPTPSRVYGLGLFCRQTLSVQQLFYESSGGTKVYFLNGYGFCTGRCNGGVTFKARASAIYVPTWYGTETPPNMMSASNLSYEFTDAISSGESPGNVNSGMRAQFQPTDYESEQIVAEHAAADVTTIEAEFELRLQALRREFKRQLDALGKH